MNLKAKQEEHKLLKQKHDILQYEVLQTKKLQDSIDEYHEKLQALKKRNLGEKKLKFNKQVESEEESIIISPSQPFNARAFDHRVGFACHSILKQTGLSSLIHENNLIADLLQRASSHRKQSCVSREVKKKKQELAPSSSSSDLESDDHDGSSSK